MRLLFTALTILAALATCGCSVQMPSYQQIKEADAGPYPENYETTIKQYMETRLTDPMSAQYKFYLPIKGFRHEPPILGGKIRDWGYWVAVDINAKNQFGGYTGFKNYSFFMRGHSVYEAKQNAQ